MQKKPESVIKLHGECGKMGNNHAYQHGLRRSKIKTEKIIKELTNETG